jgi:putative hemolysin
MKLPFVAIAAAVAVFFCGCGGSGVSGASVPSSSGALALPMAIDTTDGAAAAYCRQTGGEVEVRRPVYGSNGSSLLFLSGEKSFCQYTRKKDGSRIHILLGTLYTTKPSLAALAYILKPPPGSCQGNPASCYCSQLGGSDQFGGTTGAGGGWYEKKGIDQTLEACIFPDMSSIDSWGLAYHANGIIRGIDLQKVMRYKYPGRT